MLFLSAYLSCLSSFLSVSGYSSAAIASVLRCATAAIETFTVSWLNTVTKTLVGFEDVTGSLFFSAKYASRAVSETAKPTPDISALESKLEIRFE